MRSRGNGSAGANRTTPLTEGVDNASSADNGAATARGAALGASAMGGAVHSTVTFFSSSPNVEETKEEADNADAALSMRWLNGSAALTSSLIKFRTDTRGAGAREVPE